METFGVSTRYYGATDHRGSRIRVTYGNKHKFVSFDHSAHNAHHAAIHAAMPYLVDGVSMVEDVRYVAPTESNRGNVYLVTVAMMERNA